MKKSLILFLAGLIIFALIGFFVVSRGKKQPEEKPVTSEQIDKISREEKQEKDKESKESPTEKIDEILSRGKNLLTVKYEMVTKQNNHSLITQKVWLKKDKMRTELNTSGQTIILLANLSQRTIYQYLPSQNMAMKIQSDKAPESLESPLESIQDLKNNQATVVGTEKVDGKDCLVVEYNTGGTKIKSWIWEEKGFPVKMETSTPSGKMVTEFKNIEFVDIPDSMFELPAGVKIIAP